MKGKFNVEYQDRSGQWFQASVSWDEIERNSGHIFTTRQAVVNYLNHQQVSTGLVYKLS